MNKMRALHSDPSKTDKENTFFENFLSINNDTQIKKWERGESPDYIIFTADKKIGLEITTLVLDPSNSHHSLASIRSAQNKCLKKAKILAEQSVLCPIKVEVQFRSNYAAINVDDAANELAEFIKQNLSEIDDTRTWHFYESGLIYSKWISIRLGVINGHKWLNEHRFERNHLNWMTINPVSEIQARINEKQSKISRYLQICDECWLLIGVDEWTAPEAVAITEEIQNHVFLGDFKRLFFLCNIGCNMTEFKIHPIHKDV